MGCTAICLPEASSDAELKGYQARPKWSVLSSNCYQKPVSDQAFQENQKKKERR